MQVSVFPLLSHVAHDQRRAVGRSRLGPGSWAEAADLAERVGPVGRPRVLGNAQG